MRADGVVLKWSSAVVCICMFGLPTEGGGACRRLNLQVVISSSGCWTFQGGKWNKGGQVLKLSFS